MCAIFGYIGNYDLEKCKLSLSLMKHRGVDDTHYIESKGVFIGYNRLHIEGDETRQPLSIGDKSIVFNGEIYNYKSFGDYQSEAKAILERYIEYGEKFVDRLDGMFAIAIFDKKRLYLYRDPIGKKPLFYYYDQAKFIFASEIKGILPHIEPKIDINSISSYLYYGNTISPNTLYQGIKKLPAGHYLKFSNKKVIISKYFDLLQKKEPLDIENILINSIQKRFKPHILLSGGLDSSLIASIGSKFGKVDTYTIGYKEYPKYDERNFAKIVSKYINSNHHEIEFSRNDFFDIIDLVNVDEPISDPASIPLFKLMNYIDTKSIMSGDGGDEGFLGYRYYSDFFEFEKLYNNPYQKWLTKFVNSNPDTSKEWHLFNRLGNLSYRSNEIFHYHYLKNIANFEVVNDEFFVQNYITEFKKSQFDDYKVWLSFIDYKIYLSEILLSKIDRISMQNSVEVRSPFLDIDLIINVLNINRGFRKEQLKKIAINYLPKEIINRTKRGFSYPFMQWLRESNLLNETLSINDKLELFNKEKLRDIFGDNTNKSKIWNLFILLRFIERVGY